ncbi:MAG: putative manganese-dependent inorganic diphosphatase [Spirochaetaceae bacterium]|jgi:manganese-dependent inorganic pyrophosphatase|nr:putative manganese-dependent inorganic diphosphatase [Spirochaetaceae bacterium]
MEKTVYVIGHKNPDTDSVVSATAYARLKQIQGQHKVLAARAGKINPQTEYIFERFGVPVPEYLPDLIPKARHYISGEPVTIHEELSVWEALELLQKDDSQALPIVDRNGVYRSMLHYQSFSRYIINHINPRKKSSFPLTLNHLAATIHAQPITLFNGTELRRSPIMVAASYTSHFKEHLEAEGADNALVIVGDRWDIQRRCIERKVRALILSAGHTLSKELADLAEEKEVTVLISPFDTSSTAMLIIYSVPVGALGDKEVPLVRLKDPVWSFRETLTKIPSRCLPVADDESKIQGVIFEGDLINEPNVEVIMVDHNEPSQAIEGIENYKILEVIDHHRLGNLSTRYPITFINRVVGATCTIITNLYREQKVPLERGIASLLLCGIIADTLVLQSATTTETDIETAEYLSSITGLDIKSLGNDMQGAANQVNALSAEELIKLDMKEYTERGLAFSVSQIETDNPRALVARREEIAGVLEQVRAAQDYLFSALLVTDVTVLDSLLFVSGKKAFINRIKFPMSERGIYVLKQVVSRKKQLLPLLAELVEKAKVEL